MDNNAPPTINSRSIPVAGIGGVGMLALAVILAAAFPVVKWLLIGGLVGGALLGTLLIFKRRNHQLGTPMGDSPIGLSLGAAEPGEHTGRSTETGNPRDEAQERRLAVA